MYDIRQFKPALYALVILGLTGFCMAIDAPALWFASVMLIGVNAFLTATDRFRPIPRWVANVVTIAAGAWAVKRVADGELPVAPVGVFLAVLQLVKLYEQRGNRDHGQLIVLSLLTMVAAAMTQGGTSLSFGLLFFAWVGLSLYTCLLFHLKVEAAAAQRAMGLRDDRPADAARLRQDQRRLGSSMRRLTIAVALAAAACASVVFVAFPRGTGASLLAANRFDPSQAVTGFSGTVGFQDIARIQQNTTPIAHIALLRGGQPVRSTAPLYLRGNTLDVYESDPRQPDRWTWRRSVPVLSYWRRLEAVGGETMSLPAPQTSTAALRASRLYEQRVELEPTGVDAVFALAGAVAIQGSRQGRETRIDYFPGDGTLTFSGRAVTRKLDYVVWSTGELPPPGNVLGTDAPAADAQGAAASPVEGGPIDEYSGRDLWSGSLPGIRARVEGMRLMTAEYAAGGERREAVRRLRDDSPPVRANWVQRRLGIPMRGWSDPLDPDAPLVELLNRQHGYLVTDAPRLAADELVEFVLDPAVAGKGEDGTPLALRRLSMAGTTPLDEEIAANIERYLRTRYEYSLDVSAAAGDLPFDRDPLSWFVSADGQEGHCEFFAGTMAIACQSLGIPARVVVGFKSNEYNDAIDRFTIRQSDAHAWVEVLTHRGWLRFDPTSDTLADQRRTSPATGWAAVGQQLRHWGEFLQYAWSNHIVAYDRGRQQGVQQSFMAEIDRSIDMGVVGDDAAQQTRSERIIAWARAQTLGRLESVWRWLHDSANLPDVLARVIVVLIAVLPLAALGLIGSFVYRRWRQGREARRIGLDGLTSAEARRMTRQLGFYSSMLAALERIGVRRPDHQTPREFARSLTFLPPAAFDAVARLTDAFYRVRFGRHELAGGERRALAEELRHVARASGR